MAVAPQLAGHRRPTASAAAALSSKFSVARTTNWLVFDLQAKASIARARGVGRRASRRWGAATPVTVAALGGLLGGIFGGGTDTGESTRQLYTTTVALINQMESEISSLSDSQLREKTSALQQRAARGDSLDSLLPVCSLPKI